LRNVQIYEDEKERAIVQEKNFSKKSELNLWNLGIVDWEDAVTKRNEEL